MKIPYKSLKCKLNVTVIKGQPGTALKFSEPRNIMTSLGNDIKEK